MSALVGIDESQNINENTFFSKNGQKTLKRWPI